MEIRLVPEAVSQREFDRLTLFFNTLGLRISGREKEDIGRAVRDGFAQNFNLQQSAKGPWAPLAPFTQKQREMLGFPASRPILERTMSLFDSFTQGGAGDHYSQSSNSGTLFAIEEGSSDSRADELQRGTSRMPARSVVDLMPSAENHVGDAIRDMLVRLMRAEGL